ELEVDGWRNLPGCIGWATFRDRRIGVEQLHVSGDGAQRQSLVERGRAHEANARGSVDVARQHAASISAVGGLGRAAVAAGDDYGLGVRHPAATYLVTSTRACPPPS